MFHAEWNPGVIEQQIGRVDRIESFWEKLAMDWRVLSDDAPNGAGVPLNDAADYGGPKIRVHPVVFKGTYDEFQFTVSTNRRDTLNAHLFGELLDEERLSRMGSGAYEAALAVNNLLNWSRRKMGLPYWSLASFLKQKTKKALDAPWKSVYFYPLPQQHNKKPE